MINICNEIVAVAAWINQKSMEKYNQRLYNSLKKLIDSIFDRNLKNINSIIIYTKLGTNITSSIDLDFIQNEKDTEKIAIDKIEKISDNKWKLSSNGKDKGTENSIDEIKKYLVDILFNSSHFYFKRELIVIERNNNSTGMKNYIALRTSIFGGAEVLKETN